MPMRIGIWMKYFSSLAEYLKNYQMKSQLNKKTQKKLRMQFKTIKY